MTLLDKLKGLFGRVTNNPHVQKLEHSLARVKPYSRESPNDTSKRRGILSTLDLTSLGVGSCGVGRTIRPKSYTDGIPAGV